MDERSGMYAGCAWLPLAAFLGVGTLFGLGIGGPAALVILIPIAIAVVMAVALWNGVGGRSVRTLSLVLGFLVIVLGVVNPWAVDAQATDGFGFALFGVAISLSSAFALWADSGGDARVGPLPIHAGSPAPPPTPELDIHRVKLRDALASAAESIAPGFPNVAWHIEDSGARLHYAISLLLVFVDERSPEDELVVADVLLGRGAAPAWTIDLSGLDNMFLDEDIVSERDASQLVANADLAATRVQAFLDRSRPLIVKALTDHTREPSAH